ncbi:MAG: nucleotide sugar dehydrogenase [Acetatifactor sp.]|nr:nucleotide sugar dehydrogenase [Acetatifactor sp.]
MRIGVIGLGYVGLTFAVAAAASGKIDVFGIEVDQNIKNCLKEKKAHFYEPGLNNLIKRMYDKNFFVVESFPDDIDFDAFLITVGTPLIKGSKKPDFDYIRSALRSIQHIYDGTQLIILRSTVSVGTTRNIVLPFLSELCGKPENELMVAMCPERTVEGNAIYELSNLPQIISGNNASATEFAQKLFRCITPCVVEADSLEEAELIKLYCNTYRDMTFAIGNAFCMAAQEFNVDGIRAIEHANYKYDRSNIARPGFVAGPCLEKDAYILINNMPACDSKDFILAARQYNESMIDIVVSWVKMKTKEDCGVSVAISGMAFKGQPETSDLRGSSSVYIARKLYEAGYKLNLHDFVAKTEDMEKLNLGRVCNSIEEACSTARLLLVLNNHKKYRLVMDNPYFHFSRDGFEILDAWNVCTELHACEDIKIVTLGNLHNDN